MQTFIIAVIIFELIWQALNILDFEKTKECIELGGYEKNPLIGKYPSAKRLTTFEIGSAVAHLLVTILISVQAPTFMYVWQAGSSALKVWAYNSTSKAVKRMRW